MDPIDCALHMEYLGEMRKNRRIKKNTRTELERESKNTGKSFTLSQSLLTRA